MEYSMSKTDTYQKILRLAKLVESAQEDDKAFKVASPTHADLLHYEMILRGSFKDLNKVLSNFEKQYYNYGSNVYSLHKNNPNFDTVKEQSKIVQKTLDQLTSSSFALESSLIGLFNKVEKL